MTSKSTPNAAQADNTPGGTLPEVPPGPTVTFYQQLADQFMKELDAIAALIPQLEASHISTRDFVRSFRSIPDPFLATAIATVEQTPLLQGLKKLNVPDGHDTLQFIAAFKPVLDKLMAFAKALQFTLGSRKATLAAIALQVYDISKGLARDAGSAEIEAHVANMKRDLGRRGRPRITPAERKAKAAAKLLPAATTTAVNPNQEVKKAA
jgi:hypothetical protein